MQRVRACRILSPKWSIYYLPISSQGSVIIGRGPGETVRDRGGERIRGSRILWTWQGSCTYELTAARTSPRKAQGACTKSQHGEGRWIWSSTPSQELLAIDSCGERKYSWRVLPLMDKKKKKREDTIGWAGKGGESGRCWGSGCIWSKLFVHNSQRTNKTKTTRLLKKMDLLYLIYLQV